MKLGPIAMATALCVWATEAAAQAPKPWMGTWKLDVARSRLGGTPAPRSLLVTNTPGKDGGYDCVTEAVDAEGKTSRTEYYVRADGKEYPMKGGPATHIWVRRIDDHDNQWATLREGKVVAQGKTSYSKDGRTRTLTFTFFDGKGGETELVQVFDRK